MRINRLFILVIPIFLSACDFASPEIISCENKLKGTLKSPASYRRIDASTTNINPANPSDISNPTERWVTITYDAANSYNALLRDTYICRFPLVSGHADVNNEVTSDLADYDNLSGDNQVDPPSYNLTAHQMMRDWGMRMAWMASEALPYSAPITYPID